ncbi:MAG: hypothetical protein LBV32_01875 [Tannerellaceae bacterium]|jgi:hypothetical protein|nr:hypothetical protein [Tannerellaceae bacterium]
MKQLMYLFASLALVAMFSNCQEDIEDIPFIEYSLEGTPGEENLARWVNLDYDEKSYNAKILVINSDSELQKYAEGDYLPIDFTKKTLILAYGCLSGGFLKKDVKFQYVSNQNYVMTASGTQTLAAVIAKWQVAIIVEKLPHNSKIQFNLITKTTES